MIYISFYTLCKEVSTIEDIKNIETELAKIEEQEYRIINLYLKGVVDHETADYLDSFESQYSARFLFFHLNKDGLYLKPNLLKLKLMIPEGVIFDRIVETILALMKYHPKNQEYSEISSGKAEEILNNIREINTAVNTSPEILERAILLLYQMAKEGAK